MDAPVTPALVTPEAFSVWTSGRVPATDPRVQPLLDGAIAAVRRYCGWHIAPPQTETIRIDGYGGRELLLPTMHLTAIESITVEGRALADTDYDWSALGHVALRGGHWPNRYRAIEVTFTHGYESAPDVAQIVTQVTAAALSSPMGATREQAGQVSVSWAMTAPNVSGGLSLLERDLAVLNAYRLGGSS